MNTYFQFSLELMMVKGGKLVLETLRKIVLTTQIPGAVPLGVGLSLHPAHPGVFVFRGKSDVCCHVCNHCRCDR